MLNTPLSCCRPAGLIALLCAALVSGCAAVGPDYAEPQLPVPAGWTAAADQHPADAAALATWWRQFDDPVLDRLIADALAANPGLAEARARLREARARRGAAGAQLAPSVDASLSGSTSTGSSQTGSGATRELYRAGFDASWELDVFGGLRRGVEAAQAEMEASVESLRDTRVSLAAEVALNYIDLRTAEERLAIAEASIAARSENHEIIHWRQQAGLVSELDLAQATTDLASTRAALPLLRAAERRLAAETARLGEAEAARYPSFRLSGTLGLEALELDALTDSGADTRSLVGGITAPIFNAGRIAANIDIQDARLEQARQAYRATVLAALEEVENALTAVAETRARRARLAEAAAAAQTPLQIAQHRYQSGLADFLSVLDAQRTPLSLDEQLAGSSGELARARIRLYTALGGGWSPAADLLSATEPQ